MMRKRILACLLSAALLAGLLPTAALAAKAGSTCENHPEHTLDCGYEEGRACGHVCELCAVTDSGDTDEVPERDALMSVKNGATGPQRAPAAYAADVGGFSFDADTGVLTITSDAGTQAWRDSTSPAAVKSVVVENGVTSIGVTAFDSCTNLTQVALPESLASIGSFAFNKCANLELTTLPNGINKIGNGAFMGCKKLALTSLPENLTAINQYAFNGCESLRLTSLPNGVESIEMHAFEGCTNLALTSLPTSLKTIGRAAFWGCGRLAFSEFPASLTSIGKSAFWGCTGLSQLTFPQSTAPATEEKAFANIPGLILFVPYNATGYDGANWPAGRVVYGAALSRLDISKGALNPTFFPGTNLYSVYVDSGVEKVTVTPTAHDSETITVNGTDVASGDASGDIALTAGDSTQIHVVAKNSDADSRTYTIEITRAAPDAVAVTGVTLDQTALTLYTDKSPNSAKLTATVRPGNATTKTVTWSSSDPDVATVDGDGNVAAVSQGTATITVTTLDGGKTATCTVTVEEETPAPVAVTGVTLDQIALTLYTNKSPGTAKLTATVQPSDAANKAVTWTSSDPDVATVDGDGNVAAVSPGAAVITVTTTDGGKTASCPVTVREEGASGGGGGSFGGGSQDGGSDYIRRVLTDEATGITVTGEQINGHAALTVKAGFLHAAGEAGCDRLRAAYASGRVLALGSISLSHAFLGSVTVSIPVDGREGETLTLARCTGGGLTLSNVTVEKGRVEATVDGLTPFALLDGVYASKALPSPAASGAQNALAIPAAPAPINPGTGGPRRHRMREGDTLSALAQRYNCTVAGLMAANPIVQNPGLILAGWELIIP